MGISMRADTKARFVSLISLKNEVGICIREFNCVYKCLPKKKTKEVKNEYKYRVRNKRAAKI